MTHTSANTMCNSSLQNLNWRKQSRDMLYLTLFNTAVAVLVKYVLHGPESFFENWVFAMCIGNCINLIIHGLKFLIWKNAEPHKFTFLIMCMCCAPIGFYLGFSMCSLLFFQYPIPSLAKFFSQGNSALLIVCMVITLLIGIFFWNQSKMAELAAQAEKEKARIAALEKQAMQAQLQLLQAQIEPHMLFNTLANLQGLIALDTEKAQYMLTQLITYLRASLTSSRTQKTTLKHEFGLMQAYLELLSIRMGKRLTYTLDLPKNLENFEIAPMLLQPLVENAIKHGLEPKLKGGSLIVSARQEHNCLHLSVSDTGLGLSDDYDHHATTPSTGDKQVGNHNIRERLIALYGEAGSLHLRPNQPEGTIAELSIPVIST